MLKLDPNPSPRRQRRTAMTERTDLPDDSGDESPATGGHPLAAQPGNDMVEGWTPDDEWRPYTSEEAKRKARGGRPKLDPAKKRSAQLHILLTPAERDRIQQWAASTSLSVSDYVRRRTLGRPIAQRVDIAARGELNRIGVNLNQIARVANEAGQVELAAEARAVFEEVTQAVRALRLPAEAPPEIPHYPFRRIDE